MKTNKFYHLLGLFLCTLATQAQFILEETVQKLKSPDGAYEFTFYQKKNQKKNKPFNT